MANIITGIRVLCSIALLFFPALSTVFYILYIIAGLSDMVDGWVARLTNTVSEFGAKWDTIADCVFVAACLFKLIPVIDIPSWLYIWIGIIAAIKIFNMCYGYAVHKKFIAIHSVINKATGFLLFLFPLTLNLIDMKYSAVVLCIVATCAAIHELLQTTMAAPLSRPIIAPPTRTLRLQVEAAIRTGTILLPTIITN